MAAELTIDSTSTATATLVGAWELRAGSHDTTEYLSRGGTYPGNINAFNALQSDAANGYDPAPKMAILTLANIADSNTVTLSGGIDAITGVFMTTFTANNGQTAGLSFSGKVITLEATGSVTSGQVLVFYS